MEKIFESFTEYLQGINESIFVGDKESVKVAASEIRSKLESVAPYINTQTGILGYDTIFVDIGFEEKSKWAHGIFDNSIRIKLELDSEGTIETVIKSREIKPFRKAKAKSLDDAIAKITKYVENTKKELGL